MPSVHYAGGFPPPLGLRAPDTALLLWAPLLTTVTFVSMTPSVHHVALALRLPKSEGSLE